VILLIASLKSRYEFTWVDIKSLCKLQKLDHIKPTLTTLHFRHICLLPTEFACQVNLSQARVDPRLL
jgi:hypothetical protein